MTQWQVLWETSARDWKDISSTDEGWIDVDIREDGPDKPEGIQSAWLRLTLPPLQWDKPGLWIEQVYAFEVEAFSEEGRRLFRSSRLFSFDMNSVLIGLDASEEEQVVYLHVKTPARQLGIHDTIRSETIKSCFPSMSSKDSSMSSWGAPSYLLRWSCSFALFSSGTYFSQAGCHSACLFCARAL